MQRFQTFGDAHLGRAFTNAKDRVKAQEWREAGLRDITFGEVDMDSFRDSGCMVKIFFLIELVFSLEYVYLFASDALALWSLYKDGANVDVMTGRGIYILTVVLSMLILFFEWRAARKIIVTDDISDSFLNDLAYRRQMYRSYSVYCFFYHILDGIPFTQKFAKFTYFLLKNWKRLCFVDLPQGVIALLGASEETDRLQEMLLTIKFVIVCVRVGMLVIACLAWPLIRFMLAKRFDNKGFSLEIYVTFTIDYRINQMLGLIVDPEKPGLKPRYKVTAPDGSGRTTFVTNPNSTEGVEGTVPRHGPSTGTTATPTGPASPTTGPLATFPTPSYPVTPAQSHVQSPVNMSTHTHAPAHQNHHHSHNHSVGGGVGGGFGGQVQMNQNGAFPAGNNGHNGFQQNNGNGFNGQYNGNNFNANGNTGYMQPGYNNTNNNGFNQGATFNNTGTFNNPMGFNQTQGFGAPMGLQVDVQLPGQTFPLVNMSLNGTLSSPSAIPLMSPAGGFMAAPLLPGMHAPSEPQFGMTF